MLTLTQLETISKMLGWTVTEVEQSLDMLNHSFMTPDVQTLFVGDCEGIEEDGVYYRLSASGYMDCTDWFGPFETEESAVSDMLQNYGE